MLNTEMALHNLQHFRRHSQTMLFGPRIFSGTYIATAYLLVLSLPTVPYIYGTCKLNCITFAAGYILHTPCSICSKTDMLNYAKLGIVVKWWKVYGVIIFLIGKQKGYILKVVNKVQWRSKVGVGPCAKIPKGPLCPLYRVRLQHK